MLPGMKKGGVFPHARVTSVELLDTMGCVVVGYDIGGWQIWSIAGSKSVLQFTSTLQSNVYPVTHFCLLSPENDPHNILYLWVVHSAVAGSSSGEGCLTTATMYQLRFKNKITGSKAGVNDQYRRIESLVQSFYFALSEPMFLGKESGVFQKLLDFEAIQKINHMQGCNDFNGIVVSFESTKYIVTVLFDLNAWYFAQMPTSPNQVARLSPYIAYLPMEKTQIPSYCCLQAVKVKAKSLFRGKQSSSEACNVFPCSLNTIVQYSIGNNIINAFYFPTNELAIESGNSVEGLIELALKGVFTKHNTLVQSKKGKLKVIDFLRVFLPNLKKALNDAMSPMLSGTASGSMEIKKLRDLLTVTSHCILLGNKLKSVMPDNDGRIRLYQHTFQYVKTVLAFTDIGILPGNHNSLQDLGCKALPLPRTAIGQLLSNIPDLENLWEDGLFPPKSIRSLLNVFYTKPLDETLQVFIVSYSILYLNKDNIDLKKLNILTPEDADAINCLFCLDRREYQEFIKYLPTKSEVFGYCDINVLCSNLLRQKRKDVAKQMLLILDDCYTCQYSNQTMGVLADTLTSELKIDLISNGMANHIAFSSLLDEQLSHKQFVSTLKSLDGQERFDCLFYLILKKNKLNDLMSAYGEAQQFKKSSSQFLEFLFLYTIKHFSDIELKTCLTATGHQQLTKEDHSCFNKTLPLSSQKCQNDISILSKFCTKTDLVDFKLGSSPIPKKVKSDCRVLKTPPPKCQEELDDLLQQLRTPHPTPMRARVIHDLEAPRSILRSSKTERKNRKRIRFDDPSDECVSSSQPTRLSFGGVDFNESCSEVISSPSKRLLFDEDITSHEGVSIADISPPKPLIESVVRYDASIGADQQIPVPLEISNDNISFDVGNSRSNDEICITDDEIAHNEDTKFRFSPVASDPIINSEFNDLFGDDVETTPTAESINDSFVSATSDPSSVINYEESEYNLDSATSHTVESTSVFDISDNSMHDTSILVSSGDGCSDHPVLDSTSDYLQEKDSSLNESMGDENPIKILVDEEPSALEGEGDDCSDNRDDVGCYDEDSTKVYIDGEDKVNKLIDIESSSEADSKSSDDEGLSSENEIGDHHQSHDELSEEAENITENTDEDQIKIKDAIIKREDDRGVNDDIIQVPAHHKNVNQTHDDVSDGENANILDQSDGSIQVLGIEGQVDAQDSISSCHDSNDESIELIPEPAISERHLTQEILNRSVQVIGIESDSESNRSSSGTDNESVHNSSTSHSDCCDQEAGESDRESNDDQYKERIVQELNKDLINEDQGLKSSQGQDDVILPDDADISDDNKSDNYESIKKDIDSSDTVTSKVKLSDHDFHSSSEADIESSDDDNVSCPQIEDSDSNNSEQNEIEEVTIPDCLLRGFDESGSVIESKSNPVVSLKDVEMVNESDIPNEKVDHDFSHIEDQPKETNLNYCLKDNASMNPSSPSKVSFATELIYEDKSFVSAASETEINTYSEPLANVGEILELPSDDSEDEENFTFEPPQALVAKSQWLAETFSEYDKLTFDFSKPHEVAPKRLTRAQSKKNKIIGSEDSVIHNAGIDNKSIPMTLKASLIPASVFNMSSPSSEIISLPGSSSPFSPQESSEKEEQHKIEITVSSMTAFKDIFKEVSVPKYQLEKSGEGQFKLNPVAPEILELSGDTASLSDSEFQSFVDEDDMNVIAIQSSLQSAEALEIEMPSVNTCIEDEKRDYSDDTESLGSPSGSNAEDPDDVIESSDGSTSAMEVLEADELTGSSTIDTPSDILESSELKIKDSSELHQTTETIHENQPGMVGNVSSNSISSEHKEIKDNELSLELGEILMSSESLSNSDESNAFPQSFPDNNQINDEELAAALSHDSSSTGYSAVVVLPLEPQAEIEDSISLPNEEEISSTTSLPTSEESAAITVVETLSDLSEVPPMTQEVPDLVEEPANTESQPDITEVHASPEAADFDELPSASMQSHKAPKPEESNVDGNILTNLESQPPPKILCLRRKHKPSSKQPLTESGSKVSKPEESNVDKFENVLTNLEPQPPSKILCPRRKPKLLSQQSITESCSKVHNPEESNFDKTENVLTDLEIQPPPKILCPRRKHKPSSKQSSTDSCSNTDLGSAAGGSPSVHSQDTYVPGTSETEVLKPKPDKRPYKILRPPRTLRSHKTMDQKSDIEHKEEEADSICTPATSDSMPTCSTTTNHESPTESVVIPDNVTAETSRKFRSRSKPEQKDSAKVEAVVSPKKLRIRSKVIKEVSPVQTIEQDLPKSDEETIQSLEKRSPQPTSTVQTIDQDLPKSDEETIQSLEKRSPQPTSAVQTIDQNLPKSDEETIQSLEKRSPQPTSTEQDPPARRALRARKAEDGSKPSKGKQRPRKQTNSESNNEEKPASKVRKSEAHPEIIVQKPVIEISAPVIVRSDTEKLSAGKALPPASKPPPGPAHTPITVTRSSRRIRQASVVSENIEQELQTDINVTPSRRGRKANRPKEEADVPPITPSRGTRRRKNPSQSSPSSKKTLSSEDSLPSKKSRKDENTSIRTRKTLALSEKRVTRSKTSEK